MAGYPPQYIPPPPPPPPPGYGEVGFGSKPTSGKAIAALICGLVGVISFFCWPIALASLVGIVLGILGIVETGREGRRSGRGLAIAGTIVAVLSLGSVAASIGLLLFMAEKSQEVMEEVVASQLDADQALILERLKKYYDQNEKSLGPGGPVLSSDYAYAAPSNAAPAGNAPLDTRPRVTGTLELRHLVGEHSLGFGTQSGSGVGWELVITGKSSATLRAKDWGGQVIREIAIQDIGRNQFAQTIP